MHAYVSSFLPSPTAINGADYVGVNMLEIVFPANSAENALQTECADITIVNDSELEPEEMFFVMVTDVGSNVQLGNNVTVVSIMDDEGSLLKHAVIGLFSHSEREGMQLIQRQNK